MRDEEESDMQPVDRDLSTPRRYALGVRTTLTIDDDVLEAAMCIADDDGGATVGDVLSRLARRGLEPRPGERLRRRGAVFGVVPGA